MNPTSPLRSIWFHPSKTIAFVAHENPGYRLFILPIAAGFMTLPTVALFADEQTEIVIGFALSTLLAFGPIAELLQVFVGAYLIRLTGVWLGGSAGSSSIQTAIVWGNVPIVAMTILGIAVLMFSFVYSEVADEPLRWGQSPTVSAVGWSLLLIQTVLIVWSVVILLKGIAAVQGFSTGRALLNALLAWSIPAAILVFVTIALGFTDRLSWIFFAGFEELVVLHGPE